MNSRWNKSTAAVIGGAIGGIVTAVFPEVFDSPEKMAAFATVLTTVFVYFAPKNA